MVGDNKFYIDKDGKRYEANILSNFSVNNNVYCIYTVGGDDNHSSVYCAKVVNNELVKIDNEDEIKLTNKIVNSLLAGLNKDGDK